MGRCGDKFFALTIDVKTLRNQIEVAVQQLIAVFVKNPAEINSGGVKECVER